MCISYEEAYFLHQANCALCGGPGEVVAVEKPFNIQGRCAKCGARSAPSTAGTMDAAWRWNGTQKLVEDWKRDAGLLATARAELDAARTELDSARLRLAARDERLRGRPLRARELELASSPRKPRA